MKTNKKYYYLTTVECCVLCGVENKTRERADEKPKGINWIDAVCPQHF